MPEGPEVKLLVGQLNKLEGKKITFADIKEGPTTGLNTFLRDLPVRINSIHCKGKLIWWELSKGWFIVNHMGMEGWWQLGEVPEFWTIHIVIDGGDAWWQNFRFGKLEFTQDVDYLKNKIGKLGWDPLGQTKPDWENIIKRFRRHNRLALADVLLEQDILCGIGNYLRADIMWIAKVYPLVKVKDLKDKFLIKLTKIAQKYSREVYKRGVPYLGGKFKVYNQKLDP